MFLTGVCFCVFTVEPLMVSAGGDKKITLPVNSITLSAYALPAPEEDGKSTLTYQLVVLVI